MGAVSDLDVDLMLREVACDQVLEVTFGLDRGSVLESMLDWRFLPMYVDGRVCFALMVRGPEFHVLSLRTGAPFPMKLFRSMLDDLVQECGYACTRTPLHEAKQHRVNAMLGLKIVKTDELDVYYRLDRTCQ